MSVRPGSGTPISAPAVHSVLVLLAALVPLSTPATGLTQARPVATEAAFVELAAAAGTEEGAPFPFDYQFLAYRAGGPDSAGNMVELWAATSVHAGRVRAVLNGRGWNYALGMRFELFREGTSIASETTVTRHTLSAHIPERTSEGFPLQAAVRVPPGEYRYRLIVTDFNWPDEEASNSVEGTVIVPALEGSGPVVSSIAIAADTGGDWEPAPGVALKLNAARVVRPSARPFIYYEVSGLTPGAAFEADVRLVAGWIRRGERDAYRGLREPFRIEYRGTAPAEESVPARSALRLDLSDTEPGPYEVTVRVTDLATGKVSAVRRARLAVQLEPALPLMPVTEVAVPTTGAGPPNGAGGSGLR